MACIGDDTDAETFPVNMVVLLNEVLASGTLRFEAGIFISQYIFALLSIGYLLRQA